MAFEIPFVCKLSGLKLGVFTPNVGIYNKVSVEGMSPYVKDWKETTLLHPIFSISCGSLIIRASALHQLEKAGKAPFPILQKQLVMLALLHAEEAIVQDFPALPEPRIADTFFADVLAMVSWKHDIASDRLHFPRLHISKQSGFEQIPNWLKACAGCKDEYENVARTRQQAAKQKAKQLAQRDLQRNLFQDISLRRLWNWMEVQIPDHEKNQWPEMKDLFFAAEKNIQVWTVTEIDDLENIFTEYCELGNTISFEVSKRIAELRNQLKIYEDTFEIHIADQFPELRGTPAPVLSSFSSKAAFLVATAKWKLANKAGATTIVQPAVKSSKAISEDDL